MKTFILFAAMTITTNATADNFTYSADPVIQEEIVHYLKMKHRASAAGALCFTERGTKNIWLGFDPKHCGYLVKNLGWHMTDTK